MVRMDVRCRHFENRSPLSKIVKLFCATVLALLVLFGLLGSTCLGADQERNVSTNSFPDLGDVFQGRIFADKFSRDVFFLQAIRDRYPSHWPELLEANINIADYVQSPAKLLQFVNELGVAMRGRNDAAASASLAVITTNPAFFTNADAYHPEILQAAAKSLIANGTNGCYALAASFTTNHYQLDSQSLEDLAKAVGETKSSNQDLAGALANLAFNFSTASGASYPRCTMEAVKNLLQLPNAASLVGSHLNTNDIFADPVRFQSVIDGIAAAQASELAANLTAIEPAIDAKLTILKNSPGDYRDALDDLKKRIQKTPGAFMKKEEP